jgi:hypothetical protein
MKLNIVHILIAGVISSLSLVSCNSGSDKPDPSLRQYETEGGVTPEANPADASGLISPVNVQAGTGAVKHYICPKGCAGSGGDGEGKCPVCGSAYIHNVEFHKNDPQAPSTPINIQQPSPVTPQPTITTPPAESPAQNAKGEYHYTCPNNHPGSGNAGNCGTCNTELVHNAKYHE